MKRRVYVGVGPSTKHLIVLDQEVLKGLGSMGWQFRNIPKVWWYGRAGLLGRLEKGLGTLGLDLTIGTIGVVFTKAVF